MNKILALIFLVVFVPNSFACICTTLWQVWNKDEYIELVNYTDVIFIGELKVVSFEEDCYEFEILDVFKGDVEVGSILTGHYITSCSDMPSLYGSYLIYGDYDNFDGKSTFEYSQCSPSKMVSQFINKEETKYFEKELSFLNEYFKLEVTVK
ncbi:hypothetical protein [Gilvibacter sediminis]|uniref:hypothetical protein n=1 Tax=Gilvibacter sediminis TaxID=379071 RepID=UPI00234FB901|nr:hypothetical protein [Gilvibacter sediminis]MDC7998418.1 hypothetical protein [Gilvibacter sediminis]